MTKEIALVPTSEEMSIYQVMAKNAQTSQLFAKIGGEAGLLSIMLMARELGLPPMQALMGGMSIIQGKVELSPRMMNGMIRKAGHKIEIVESTDQKCELIGIRNDGSKPYTCTFTLDDARRAGLVRGGGGYEKFASDMLFARCLSRLARRLFADVISTAYVEGEIDGSDAEAQKPTVLEKVEIKATEVSIEEPKSSSDRFDEFRMDVEDKLGKAVDGAMLQRYVNHMVEVCKASGKPKKPSEIMASALINIERFEKGYNDWLVIEQEEPKEL